MKRLIETFCIVLLFAALASAEDPEVRTWTSKASSSGKVFTASGYLKDISDDGESVILVIDGKEKTVKIDRLSQNDKEYITYYLTERVLDADDSQTENPFSVDTADPAAPAETFQDNQPARSDTAGLSAPAAAVQQNANIQAAPREGELFSFMGEELPVLKPIYGIYLGESIQGLSQRFSVHKNWRQRQGRDMDDLVKEYTIKYFDDLVKSLSVCTIQDRVYSVTLDLADDSYEQCMMIHKQMKAKYGPPLEDASIGFLENHSIWFSDMEDFIYIDLSNKDQPVRIQVDAKGVYYRYAKMGELFEQRRSEFRADKVKDRF